MLHAGLGLRLVPARHASAMDFEVALPQVLLGQPPDERVLEVFADVSVLFALERTDAPAILHEALPRILHHLRAVDDARAVLLAFVGSLTQPGSRWVPRFEPWLDRTSRRRAWLWFGDSCISQGLVPVQELGAGPAMRRLDAVLDVADAPFCAADVQTLAAAVADSLAEAKVNEVVRAGTRLGAGVLASAAVQYGDPGIVGAALKHGRAWALDRLTAVDDAVLGLSRLVTAAWIGKRTQDDAPELRQVQDYVVDQLAQAPGVGLTRAEVLGGVRSPAGLLLQVARRGTDQELARTRVLLQAHALLQQLA